MKFKRYSSEHDEAQQKRLMNSRRDFLTKASLVLASSGLNILDARDILNKKWEKIFPQAHAQYNGNRILEICLRSGVPNIMFAAGKEFSQLSAPTYSNFSYSGTDIHPSGLEKSQSYFNTYSKALLEFAPYIANTQGLEVDVGHTGVFSTRHGGKSLNQVPAIVELANKNPSRSLIGGVQWKNGGLIENKNLGTLSDLTSVDDESFKALFKKPALSVSAAEVSLITEASKALSRRQALLLESQLENAQSHAASQGQVATLISTDFSTLLNTADFDSSLKAAGYASLGENLGLAVKGMSLNLINSATVAFQVGDLHGYQDDKQLATVTQSLSNILAALVKYMQKTTDQGNPGSTLWDSTTIVITSEFTRGISRLGGDNSDSGSNGIMFLGKQIQGGYYGSFNLTGSGSGTAHGFDPMNGYTAENIAPVATALAHRTTRYLAGLEDGPTAINSTLKCMLRV